MQSCAIDLQQRLFRCSHCEKKIVSETCEKQSQKYLVSESRVHHFKGKTKERVHLHLPRGSGCGAVGRAAASDTDGLWFGKIYIEHLFSVNCIEKTKKRPGMAHF